MKKNLFLIFLIIIPFSVKSQITNTLRQLKSKTRAQIEAENVAATARMDSITALQNINWGDEYFNEHNYQYAYGFYRNAESHCPSYLTTHLHLQLAILILEHDVSTSGNSNLDRADKALIHLNNINLPSSSDSTNNQAWYEVGLAYVHLVDKMHLKIKEINTNKAETINSGRNNDKTVLANISQTFDDQKKEPLEQKALFKNKAEFHLNRAKTLGNANADSALKLLNSIINKSDEYIMVFNDHWSPGDEKIYGSREELDYQIKITIAFNSKFLCRHIGFKEYYNNYISEYMESYMSYSVDDAKYTKLQNGDLKLVKKLTQRGVYELNSIIPHVFITYIFNKDMRIQSVKITGTLISLSNLFNGYWPKGSLQWYNEANLKKGTVAINRFMGDLVSLKWEGLNPVITITKDPDIPPFSPKL